MKRTIRLSLRTMPSPMDIMTPNQRHKAMAHNRGRTGPERALASGLWHRGIRYFTGEGYKAVRGMKLHGNPDLVLPRKRMVIFVDGCFWHGCPQCRRHEGLKGEFWVHKIAGNKARDRRVVAELEGQGWTVIRIPEHDVNTKSALSETVDRLVSLIGAAPPGSAIRDFVLRERPYTELPLTAVSLFSGAGLSDLGYEMAGFRFVVQVEVNPKRAAIGAANFPCSTWLTRDVCGSADEVATAYHRATSRRLDLLVATPPCQGMSSSNPSRGKRQSPRAQELEAKNRLMLEMIPIARRLKPRVIVAENVRPVLTLNVEYEGANGTVIDHIRDHLSDYEVFPGVVNVADYGIPQVRKRALVVAIHKGEPCLADMLLRKGTSLPTPTHSERTTNGALPWVSIRQWLQLMEYDHLDAKSEDTARGKHWLHFVPSYGSDRYMQISQIPPNSGRSAFDNDVCISCGRQEVAVCMMQCPTCGSVMRNRPYVERDGQPSLIKGFKSSYRRMNPDRPAYTITTNSSHIGSDFKIHPWENRVLSILECADIQTVPRFYDWTRASDERTLYLIRNLVGEAFPPYFTYLHGLTLANALSSSEESSRPSRAVFAKQRKCMPEDNSSGANLMEACTPTG